MQSCGLKCIQLAAPFAAEAFGWNGMAMSWPQKAARETCSRGNFQPWHWTEVDRLKRRTVEVNLGRISGSGAESG
jgi:hypothetical protein